MILLSKEQIKHLHSKLIQETGGINGIRGEGLLDSAVICTLSIFWWGGIVPNHSTKGGQIMLWMH